MIRTLKTFKKQLVRILSLFILMSVIGCISSGAKNIAFRRVVYQSSAINFDATGQLVTDGIFTINKNDSISQNEKLDSRWISKTNQNEWIYIDLGIISRISEIKLHWDSENFASKYEIQISDNAKAWDTIYSNQNGNGGTEHCCVKNIKARFVRLNCITGKSEHFSLVEMEVFGTNDLNIQSNLVSNPLVNGIQYLRDGNWVVERASQVSEPDGVVLSSSYFDDSNWLPAKVPGTVLTSYLQAGAIADPNYGDQQKLISDSYFTADFWYRNKFVIPSSQQGKTTWLNFNAINWKADVYFNGNYLGHIDGAFIRGQFNISEYVNWGGDNYLAVLIHKNDTPGEVTVQTKEYTGPNGGLLGADSPTIHASVGWDWLPTIRGRNIGIYDDVYISYTQDVQLRNPWVLVDLDTETKDFSKAELTVKTEIRNSSSNRQDVVVKGKIQPSGLEFQSPVFTLAPNENREVVVAKVVMENPHLWWPNTYGEPFLYDMEMAVLVNDICSDSTNFQFGVRKFTYDTQNALAVYCNGTRIICRGGNWGMDDGNLAATDEEYDIKIRMHAEANFTMIRNWVGMTRKDDFYRSCDKYGILVWDDFWLANPGDGPNPNDEDMFMRNAIDKIKRNRRHASIALYCGRNEGNPPESLNKFLADITKGIDGTRLYIPHSANGSVSGWGPYCVKDREWYFENTYPTIHSERGMPNIPTYESLLCMLPPENRWPIDEVWGIHDFTMGGAQCGKTYLEKVEQYGTCNALQSFSRTAQMVNYIGHKAIFESVYVNNANGMLMWMSQSSWPSMVWQTYDYYYDTNAGYFAVKQANQSINLIYNPSTDDFVLTNYGIADKDDLQITIQLFHWDGRLITEKKYIKSAVSNSRNLISKLHREDLSGIIFIKSKIFDGRTQVSENFTWINVDNPRNYRKFSEILPADLKSIYKQIGQGMYQVEVTNAGFTPALLVCIKAVYAESGKRILPVYFEDNYFSLMPGESKMTIVEVHDKSVDTKKISFSMEAWNTPSESIRLLEN